MKKYLWLVIILAIVVVYLIFTQSQTVEYTELSQERPYQGNAEASVVIMEFSDFQCSACAASQAVVKEVLEKYPDKVKLEFYHLPLTSTHHQAYQAAEAAECAGDQGKFWEYHDLLFANQNNLGTADLEDYAKRVGLDVEIWRDCMTTDAKEYHIEKDKAEAEKHALNSTPTFYLNGQKVSDWRTLPEMVQALVEPLVPLQNEASSTEEIIEE